MKLIYDRPGEPPVYLASEDEIDYTDEEINSALPGATPGTMLATAGYGTIRQKAEDGSWVTVTGGGGSSTTVEELSVTENGTYTADTGKAYSPVTVNVPSAIPMWKIGAWGGYFPDIATSLTVIINGFNGKYALISVMHRSELTAPSGCTLLDKTTYEDASFSPITPQYVSLFKIELTSDSVTLVFSQAESNRIGATAWATDRDFNLTNKVVAEFQDYYNTKFDITATAQTFFTFSAFNAQSTSNKDVLAISDGAWLNHATQHITAGTTYDYTYQLRHFTGIIDVPKTCWIQEIPALSTQPISATSSAQVVTYNIVPA